MSDIIDFKKYRDEATKEPGGIEAFLKKQGADKQLIEFAVLRQNELYEENKSIGQFDFSVSLPEHINQEVQLLIQSQIHSEVDKLIRKSMEYNMKLAGRLLLAEIKLFQYESD